VGKLRLDAEVSQLGPQLLDASAAVAEDKSLLSGV
jgi:hypothetical protein